MPKILAGTARLMAVSARRGVSREILGTIVTARGKLEASVAGGSATGCS
jgi:hypothetical protein